MTHFSFALLSPLAAAALAAATPALAADPAWKVVPPKDGAASMTRTIGNVTLTYIRTPGDYDSLAITVADCGDEPWNMESSLAEVDTERLHEVAGELFENARNNCEVPDDLEARFTDGLDAAFAKAKPYYPPHLAAIGGWSLVDKGSQPGDDSERSLSMKKALDTVSMTYSPGENGEGASFNLEFAGCDGHSFNYGFDFGSPPEDHVKVVNEEVAEAYADFGNDCKDAPAPQAALMGDFPQALKTIEQWLKAKPFVYPDYGPETDEPGKASESSDEPQSSNETQSADDQPTGEEPADDSGNDNETESNDDQ